ncbi:MAG: response regulator [Hyphomicrobiales bacterium]|nr:response regulator [Hyphomicrobiales bacterium]
MDRHFSYGRDIESLDVALVDDAIGVVRIMRSILSGLGVARVRTFAEPKLALQCLLGEPPDLLVTNTRLSRSSGCRLVRMIRHQSLTPLCFVPAVIVSGHARRRTVEEAFLSGAHQFLVLPLSPKAFGHRVEWLLRDDRKLLLEGERYVIEGVDEIVAASRGVPGRPRGLGDDTAGAPVPEAPALPMDIFSADPGGAKPVWEI